MAKKKKSKKKSAAKNKQNKKQVAKKQPAEKKKSTEKKQSSEKKQHPHNKPSTGQKSVVGSTLPDDKAVIGDKKQKNRLRPQFLIIYLLIAALLSYGLISVKEKKDYERKHPPTSEDLTSAVSTTKRKKPVKDSGSTPYLDVYDDWEEPTLETTTDTSDEETTTKKSEEASTTKPHTETKPSETTTDATTEPTATEPDTTKETTTEEPSTDPVPSENPSTE